MGRSLDKRSGELEQWLQEHPGEWEAGPEHAAMPEGYMPQGGRPGRLGDGTDYTGLLAPQISDYAYQYNMPEGAADVYYNPRISEQWGNEYSRQMGLLRDAPVAPVLDDREADNYTGVYADPALKSAERRQYDFNNQIAEAQRNSDILAGLNVRQGQWGNQLYDVATGRAGPSAAELERTYALDQAQRQALSTAAGARQAGAYRAALDTQAQLGNTAAQQGMIGRANEMATARGELTANYANQAGTLQAQQGATQLGGTLAASAASAANDQAKTANEIGQAQFEQEAAKNQAAREDFTARQQAIQGMGGLARDFYGQSATASAATTDARLRGEELKQSEMDSRRGMTQDTAKFNAGQRGKTAKAIFGAIGTMLGGGAMSDVRAKTNIAAFPAEQAQDDLRQVGVYGYDYTEPYAPGRAPGRQVGPMAQELAATPTFRGAVQPGPDGMLAIDPGRLTLGTLAAQKGQQEQIDEQEAEIARLKGELEKGVSDYEKGKGKEDKETARPLDKASEDFDRYGLWGQDYADTAETMDAEGAAADDWWGYRPRKPREGEEYAPRGG